MEHGDVLEGGGEVDAGACCPRRSEGGREGNNREDGRGLYYCSIGHGGVGILYMEVGLFGGCLPSLGSCERSVRVIRQAVGEVGGKRCVPDEWILGGEEVKRKRR